MKKLHLIVQLFSIFVVISFVITSSANSLIKITENEQTFFSSSHKIFGTANYSDGIIATSARVDVISPIGALYTYVTFGNNWEVNCGDPGPNWPSGTPFTVYISGCCGHDSWAGKKSGSVSGDENNMGNIIIYPNKAPNEPSIPIGPKFLKTGVEANYSTNATDPNGIHKVRYRFDWDSEGINDLSQFTSYVASGEFASKSHSWLEPGIYVIRAQAQDQHSLRGNWSDGFTIYVYETNNPPNEPSILGQTTCQLNETIEFEIVTVDPEDQQIKYLIDWGDGTNSSWIGPYNSGESINVNHKWNKRGNHEIKVKAMDFYEFESDWSNPFSVLVTAPEIEIIKSTGGFFSMDTKITNVGDYAATDVQWSLYISDAPLIHGSQIHGTKNALEPDEYFTINSNPIFGLGKTDVKIEVSSSNCNLVSKEFDISVFFFYIKIIES